MMPRDRKKNQMAFSFLKTFLSAFRPASVKQGPGLAGYYKQVSEKKFADEEREIVDEAADFQLSEWEKEERRWEEERRREIPEAHPVSLEEGFLEAGEWIFAVKSHHVNAMKWDKETDTLTVQYQRGDTWEYDPVSLVLAQKFVTDLLTGSPGTDVWDYLRVRGAGNEHEHQLNAKMIAGPSEGPDWKSIFRSRH